MATEKPILHTEKIDQHFAEICELLGLKRVVSISLEYDFNTRGPLKFVAECRRVDEDGHNELLGKLEHIIRSGTVTFDDNDD